MFTVLRGCRHDLLTCSLSITEGKVVVLDRTGSGRQHALRRPTTHLHCDCADNLPKHSRRRSSTHMYILRLVILWFVYSPFYHTHCLCWLKIKLLTYCKFICSLFQVCWQWFETIIRELASTVCGWALSHRSNVRNTLSSLYMFYLWLYIH